MRYHADLQWVRMAFRDFSRTVVMVIVSFKKTIERASRDASVQRLTTALLRMVLELDKLTDLTMNSTSRRRLVGDVVRISRQLTDLHDFQADPASEWSRSQMRLAGDNFLRLAAWIYFPQDGTLANLKSEVILYANILLSGHLHQLPRGVVGAEEGLVFRISELAGWRKVTMHSAVAVYFMLPVF